MNSDTGETESNQQQQVEQRGGKTRKLSKFGSRRQVYNGKAEKTSGGLRKENLTKNERGRIVSVKRHSTMKQRYSKTDS